MDLVEVTVAQQDQESYDFAARVVALESRQEFLTDALEDYEHRSCSKYEERAREAGRFFPASGCTVVAFAELEQMVEVQLAGRCDSSKDYVYKVIGDLFDHLDIHSRMLLEKVVESAS
ncbi:hypothetical protein NDU88_004569 [Pleurodeles waltl]|uniref:Uncharacterized protein n=1 Tax=Pleurodeles waltl TaxID=8319 RepID=A0AAV7TRN0_PLEWA|nr:hypothetical protein NDU88_004569 [Pleurodeles waltl]